MKYVLIIWLSYNCAGKCTQADIVEAASEGSLATAIFNSADSCYHALRDVTVRSTKIHGVCVKQ